MAEILGGGVGGFGRREEDDESVDLGAKKREMTCCFCFPMPVVVAPPCWVAERRMWVRHLRGSEATNWVKGFVDLARFLPPRKMTQACSTACEIGRAHV